MLVLSLGNTKKKLRWALRVLLLAFLLLLFWYALNHAVTVTTPLADNATAEREHHYPGEPLRVHETVDDYWARQLAVLEK